MLIIKIRVNKSYKITKIEIKINKYKIINSMINLLYYYNI